MVTPAHKARCTVEEVLAIPEDNNRHEVLRGRHYVTPAPVLLHERAVLLLTDILRPYAAAFAGEAFGSRADIVLSPETLVQPDIFVVPRQKGVRLITWEQVKALLLTVEVISPKTARRDRTVKRDYYQTRGVPEYRIVDNTKRQVERWRPGSTEAEVIRDTLAWRPVPTHAPLTIDLVAFFQAVFDE
jgi:Uma2 family endonuclease